MTGPLAALLHPEGAGGWLELLGLLVFAMFVGLATAAVGAARSLPAGQEP
jgi:hypothetical protein